MIRKAEKGYSLLEVLIATALLVAVFVGFGTFLLKFTRASAEMNETAKATEDAGFSATALRTDLESVGRNLTVQENQPFAGDQLVAFAPHLDYTVASNYARRASGTSSAPLVSNVRFRGNSSLHFTGINFNLTFPEFGDAAPQTWSLSRVLNGSAETIQIALNGTVKATIQNPGVSSDRALDVLFNSAGSGANYSCLATFKIAGETVYQGSYNCSANFRQIYFDIPQNNAIFDTQLVASEIVPAFSGSSSVRLPLLPVYAGMRMTIPFVSTNGGFITFAGDSNKEAMVLTQAVSIPVSSSDQAIFVGDSSGIAAGNVLLLIDFVNNRSVLLKVSAAAGAVTVHPIYDAGSPDTPGFENFYSLSSDFSAFTFQRGSRVVKLASPVEYRIIANGSSDEISLYRRASGSAWELVLPSILNPSLATNATSSSFSFDASYDIATEGVETQRSTQNVRMSVNPRALNRIFDVR